MPGWTGKVAAGGDVQGGWDPRGWTGLWNLVVQRYSTLLIEKRQFWETALKYVLEIVIKILYIHLKLFAKAGAKFFLASSHNATVHYLALILAEIIIALFGIQHSS